MFAEATSQNYGSMRGGNARWQAPEVLDPEKFGSTSARPTMASDVFAVGCVCIEVTSITFTPVLTCLTVGTCLKLCTSKAPYADVPNSYTVAVRVLEGLRPSRPRFSDGSAVPEGLWFMMTLCWSAEIWRRPTAVGLVERTQALVAGCTDWSSNVSTLRRRHNRKCFVIGDVPLSKNLNQLAGSHSDPQKMYDGSNLGSVEASASVYQNGSALVVFFFFLPRQDTA